MSKLSKPPTLLSTFNVKEKRKLEQEPEDVNAPPMSSGAEDEDEEEEEEPPPAADLKLRSIRAKKEVPLESDDSEPERSNRGNIKRTNFPTSSIGKSREKTARKTRERGGKQSAAEDTEEASSSSSKRRRVTSESEIDSASQFVDKRGFTKSLNAKSKYGTFNGTYKYGKGSQASRGSQVSRTSQDSQTKKGLSGCHLLVLTLTCRQAKEMVQIVRL
jgi:hypothetical protein